MYLVLVQQIPRLAAIILAFKLFLSGLVHLMVGNHVIETCVFLDSGSNTTMCLSSLAEDLGGDCTPVEVTLSTLSGNQK
jgi:hypothetical protein